MCPEFVLLTKSTKPAVTFINHLESIHHRLNKAAFPIHLPIGFEQSVNGVVDLINMKATPIKNFTDHELIEGEVPEDMLEKAKRYRSFANRKCCCRR
jgi:elongation factor G